MSVLETGSRQEMKRSVLALFQQRICMACRTPWPAFTESVNTPALEWICPKCNQAGVFLINPVAEWEVYDPEDAN